MELLDEFSGSSSKGIGSIWEGRGEVGGCSGSVDSNGATETFSYKGEEE